jgi:hypothetical protein
MSEKDSVDLLDLDLEELSVVSGEQNSRELSASVVHRLCHS